MKKMLDKIPGTFLVMMLWAVSLFVGRINGWLHKPVADHPSSEHLVEAVEEN